MKKILWSAGSLLLCLFLFSCGSETGGESTSSSDSSKPPHSEEHIHAYQVEEVVAPTCLEGGYSKYVCSCGDSYEGDIVDALGHSLIDVPGQEPTCEVNGYNDHQYCERCDYTTKEIIEAPGHDYEITEVDATCQSEGYRLYQCKNCEHSYTIGIGGFGDHDLVYHQGKEATCEEDGYDAYYTCNNCDYTTYNEVYAFGHSFTYQTINPTCEEDGYTIKSCQSCDYSEIIDPVDANGHSLVHVFSQEATCQGVGWEEYDYCLYCDYSTKVEIAKKPHTPSEDYTCDSEEKHHTYCSTCGETLPLEDHMLVNGICKCGFNNSLDYLTIIYKEDEDKYYLTDCDTSAEYIYIPDYVDVISREAFRNCTSLKYVHIPEGVEEIGWAAFAYCSLDELIIPGTVTSITENFVSNSGIKKLVFQEGVVNIYSNCLSDLDGLDNLESLYLPSTLEILGYNNLSQNMNNTLENLYYHGDIFDFVNIDFQNEFPLYAVNNFYHLNKETNEYQTIETLVVPDTVTKIEKRQFLGLRQLKEVVLHEGVVEIDDYAFQFCTSLEKINLTSSLERIGLGAFASTNFKSITLPFIGEKIDASSSNSVVSYIFGTSYYDSEYITTLDTLEEIILMEGITKIPNHAFWNLPNLSKVIFPDTLTSPIMFSTSFHKDIELEGNSYQGSIYLPSNSNPYYMFYKAEDNQITSLSIHEDCQVIYQHALEELTLLEELETPFVGLFRFSDARIDTELHMTNMFGQNLLESFETLTIFGMEDVYGVYWFNPVKTLIIKNAKTIDDIGECGNLQKVIISEGLVEIKDTAFFNDYSLISIELPDSLETIGISAFSGCYSLEELDLPNNLKSIGNEAFNACSKLTTITIPDSVTSLGENILSGCSSLVEITTPFLGETKDCETSNRLLHLLKYENGMFGNFIEQYPSLKKVTLTNIEYLSNGAFVYADGIEEIVLPDTLKTIGSAPFNQTIKKLTIPFVGLIKEFDYSPNGRNKLSTLIPESETLEELTIIDATNLYEDALDLTACDLPNLKVINILSSIESIGENAINGFDNITLIELDGIYYLPAGGNSYEVLVRANENIEELKIHPDTKFILPNALENVDISSLNIPVLLIDKIDNIDISNIETITITNGAIDSPLPIKYSHIKKLILRNVTSICDEAFVNVTSLQEVSFDNNLVSFGNNAFANLESFSKVYYQGPLKDWVNIEFATITSSPVYFARSIEINNELIDEINLSDFEIVHPYTFAGWDNLKKVIIEENRELVSEVFDSCENIETYVGSLDLLPFIPINSLKNLIVINQTYLYSYLFPSEISSLDLLELDSNLEWIQEDTFINLTSLDKFSFNGTLSQWLNVQCDGLGAIPSAISGNLYINDTEVTSLDFEEIGVDDISYYRFANLKNLSSINLNGVTSIGEYAFKGSGLVNVVIPDTITQLPRELFASCEKLESVDLGDGVERVGNKIFDGCISLTTINLGSNFTYFNGNNFGDCNITNIVVDPLNPHFYFENGCLVKIEDKSLVYICKGTTTIADGVEIIPSYVFSNFNEIETFVVPSSVKEIQSNAFFGMSGLKSITLPRVFGGRFGELFGLYETFENTVQININNGLYVFYLPKELKEVTISGGEEIPESYFEYHYSIQTINLPSSLKTIEMFAFRGCDGLVNIFLPQGLEEIGYEAFNGCFSLENIVIPSSLKQVGYMTFYNCINLSSVTIEEGVETLGDNSFGYCINLKEIVIPNSVTYCFRPFEGCYEIRTITMGNCVDHLGALFGGIQYQNSYLASLRNGITYYIPGVLSTINFTGNEIKDSMFYNCSDLDYINFNNQVSYIGSQAFYATQIKSLVIPGEVTISGLAFNNMIMLESIIFNGSVASIGNNIFDGIFFSGLKQVVFKGSFASSDINSEALSGFENNGVTKFVFEGRVPDTLISQFLELDSQDYALCAKDESITISWAPLGINASSIHYYSSTYSSGCYYYDENEMIQFYL